MGQPHRHGLAAGGISELLVQQSGLVEAAGQITPVARVDVAAIAQQGPQPRKTGRQLGIMGGRGICPELQVPAPLQQGQQQQAVDVAVVTDAAG